MTTWQAPPSPQIVRISKEDGSEEPTELLRALRLLRDAYPGYSSDAEIIAELEAGTTLQTMFAYYKVEARS